MSLDDTISKLKLLMSNDSKTIFDQLFDLDYKIQVENWTSQYYKHFENRHSLWKVVIIFFYSLIVFVSFFGNSIVCKIVFWNSTMRSTTNIYIGNLSISDLLMTILNVPLQLIQILCRNWPLGNFLCRCLPFFQGLFVNVSSFTMACIAIDRYQIIAYPLKPRPGMTSIILKIIFIWIMATMASSPYPIISGVEDDITYDKLTRCRLIYPEPKYKIRQSLTVITVTIQYLAPLSITGITYFKICCIIWRRRPIGIISERQRHQRYMAKWKTIKMLIIVFLVFAICWLPLSVYHIYQDFREIVGPKKHNPKIFLICHGFAMSSICYNPFLYCWLNKGFRTAAKSYLQFFIRNGSNQSTKSSEHLKRRRTDLQKNKDTSRTSTFSGSLKFLSSFKKSAFSQSTRIELFTTQNLVSKKYAFDNVELKMSCFSKNKTKNKCKLGSNLELETIDILIDAKETVI